MDNPWADERWDERAISAPAKDDLADDGWSTAWATSGDTHPRHRDQWEAARQEKEELDRAVPPELLDSILRHCQNVLQETWPTSESNDEDSWRSGFDGHADVAALLAQLVPPDSTLPPTLQFSATATAKAMNEALKLTRHFPASASSPLSRLLASKGSLEWEKSIKAKQDVVPDTAHVGWRVLEKEDRVGTLAEESKSKKATGGLLSLWNRRTSTIQAAPVETPRERSSSPARSSLESAKSAIHPPSSRAASPSKSATPSVRPPPPTEPHPAVVSTASAPSAVSRFLNRFSRTRGAQDNSLALSSDDLSSDDHEFLYDIMPNASDPPDEDINDSALEALTGASHSSPPPIPPPPKQPSASSRRSSALGLGAVTGMSVTRSAPTAFQMQTANHTPNVPLLAPPLSPIPPASLSRIQSPSPSLKAVATISVASGRSNTTSIQQRLRPSPQSNSQPHSFTLPPHQKTNSSLSIPPLLPPPPVSPPPTPRPTTFPPGHSSTMRSADAYSFHDSYDSDDEFSAFASFPPSAAAPFPKTEPYPSQGPPSPPPRRTYERTHYQNSSSTSPILSPASQTSLDQLYTTSSASLDSFDDFVSPPLVMRGESKMRTPSPPPLPIKPQYQQPPRLDAFAPRIYHAHTSSQTSTSPTVHTSLMSSAFSVPSEEHRRTQGLVNHAAARGGILWPNSSDTDDPRVKVIPPPPSSLTSPKPLIGEEGLDLLGDDDTLSGGLRTLPAPPSAVGGSTVSPLAVDASRTHFGVAGSPGKGLGFRNHRQPSPPPLPSTSAPIPSFSSLGKPVPLASQLTKPKQTGGLSAQDLSFFEGL